MATCSRRSSASGYLRTRNIALDVDYAQLQKIYGAPNDAEMRCNSPAKYNADMKVVSGNPDSQAFSEGFVERQILTMRMGTRLFTILVLPTFSGCNFFPSRKQRSTTLSFWRNGIIPSTPINLLHNFLSPTHCVGDCADGRWYRPVRIIGSQLACCQD